MTTPAEDELQRLQLRVAELQREIRNDKLAPIKVVVEEALRLTGLAPDGPSLYDTSTGANHWSHKDEIERNLEQVLSDLDEWASQRASS